MHKTLSACVALAILCLPTLAPAARDTKPVATSKLVKTVSIPHQQFTLSNGLRVIVHTDRKAPVVAVSIWYDVGSKHEPKGKTGFAHLFEHLMFNGSENSPGDFFEPLQKIGATDFNGTTWYDRTNYFQTVPKAALDAILFLESDRMGHLLGAVTQEKLTNQIGVVQNEKRQGDNQPYGMVEYAQTAALFPPDHPYGHSTIGSMDDLTGATLEDVKAWFRQHYGPNNAVLVLAGDVDVKTVRPLVEKYFGDIPRGPQQQPVAAPVPTLPAPKAETLKDRVATVRLYRNWALPGMADPDAVPLDIGGTVLGGLSSSRLDNLLVRQEKLAVSVTAGTYSFAQMGMFEVTVNVRPGVDPDKVSARLDQIIADYIKTGPTADEVNRAVTREVSGRIGGLESVGGFGGKAVALAEGALYMKDSEFYKKNLQAFAQATPQQVTAAMQKWLTRPVYALRVIPGEREAYQESASGKAGSRTFAPSYFRAPAEGEQPLAPAARAGSQPATASPAGSKVDRSKLPDVGPIADLDFPEVERARLKNGMAIVYSRRTAVPKTQVSLSFDAGYAADPKGRLGTQSLMLALLDEGTTTKDSTALAEAQERLGATISSGASLDRTSVGLSALSANLAPSLSLFADVVRNPAFDPKEVERLRAQQLARIASELTQPSGMAGRVLPPLLFGKDHPYGIAFSGTGDADTVKSLTRDELVAFHKAWFRPEKATFFVVSDQPLPAIVKALDARFGDWKGEGAPEAKRAGSAPVQPKPRIILVNRPDSPQSLILGGHLIPLKGREEVTTLLTANEILGQNFLSRLNMDLRETKGWSYGVNGTVQRPEGDMAYIVSAPVQANRTGESITALVSQMKSILSDKPITEEERNRTVDGNIRELPGSFETGAAVMSAMQRNAYLGRADDYYDTLASRYRAMTTADLNAALKGIIRPDDFLWVVVGDAKIVRPQLEKLGLPLEDMAISLPTPDSVRGE